MTASGVDPRWGQLGAPAKAALRWAWAMALARSGSNEPVVDSVDLLGGIMLADLRGSPASELLEHYGIPAGAVARRERGRAPSVRALLDAIERVPDGRMPPLDSQTNTLIERILADARSKPDHLVSLRRLFGGLLVALNPAATAIREQLAMRGVDADQIVQSYREFLAGRTPYGEFLRTRFPYRPPRVELPAYLADRPQDRDPDRDELPDLVGITAEIDAFAYLIASTRLVPPLAIGLFGDWGSGKSYFLRSLQRRIDLIARDTESYQPESRARPPFHPHIVQIEFNAWQYVGGDLWASLLEHLFRNLRRTGDDSDSLLAQRQHYWIRKVQGATTDRVEAELKRKNLELKRDAAQQQVDELRQVRDQELAALERRVRESPLDGWRPSEGLRQRIREAVAPAGVAAVGEQADELATELGQARDALRGMASVLAPIRARGWRYQVAVASLVLLPVAVTLILQAVDIAPFTATVVSVLATAIGYVKLVTSAVNDATARIRRAQEDLAAEEAQQRTALDEKVAEAERALSEVQEELDQAVIAERDLTAKAAEVQAELAATTPRRVLNEFLADRLASEDYRSHLGLPALVRRDLERLSQLVSEQRNNPENDPVPAEYAIDRIVLYIDDLDRCPTELVIKVLEAVHLLLAFPLFVVVVAVDSRWLTSSLREHYAQLRRKGAVPEDYLEKIFQVPFWVLPLDTGARQQILRGLLTPSLTDRSTVDESPGQAVNVLPRDDARFRELVESFASTDRRDQVWRAATGLTITPEELLAIEDAADLIGGTPRAVKRYVNIYLLVRSMGLNRGWKLPQDGQLAVLLAVKSSQVDDAAVSGWLAAHPDRKELDMSGLAEWAGLVSRFRFTS